MIREKKDELTWKEFWEALDQIIDWEEKREELKKYYDTGG